MFRKPNFTANADSLILLCQKVDIGQILELDSSEVAQISPHLQGHPETIYIACSGVCLTGQQGCFLSGAQQIAVEWVRKESKQKPKEPECNTYRYLFGLTKDGKCLGYDVTQLESSPSTGQVADHWTTFDEAVKRHFPEEGAK